MNLPENNAGVQGYLALILHAHLPYIRHHEHQGVMEERWFYEAVTETYLPLIDVFEQLIQDRVPFRVTLSLTPTLLSMMDDPVMQKRADLHLQQLIRLAQKEQQRLNKKSAFFSLAQMYEARFRKLQNLFRSCGYNLIDKFKRMQEINILDIITSSATHSFLPLIKNEEAIRAQIDTAVKDYERFFHRPPRGIWLPECGYAEGIDRIVKSAGIDYFIADAAAVKYASPKPNRDVYAPLMTPYGVSAFARDPLSSEQVWSSENGYPGDYNYREYYRDIGWDLGWNNAEEWEYIRPHLLPDGERIHTGIKYYRITGKDSLREPYNPDRAMERAEEHAGNFMFNREHQAKHWNYWLDREPIIVTSYDAELFGHWWFEGPQWINFLCRKIAYDQNTIRMITPAEYLDRYPAADTAKLNESSWGRESSAEVWLQGSNDWVYRHLHHAEARMIHLATNYRNLKERTEEEKTLARALNQAARELMLAESSDWAFIMNAQSVVSYAVHRTKNHLIAFNSLCDQIAAQHIDVSFLSLLEEKNNCFPLIDFHDYVSINAVSPCPEVMNGEQWCELMRTSGHRRNIFMLAWEYPPKQVGGLSRAVCDLSETLAKQDEIVHVITTGFDNAPAFEQKNGVYIHRVPVHSSGNTEFYNWIFEMNLSMVNYLVRWKENGGRIDVLHAHDWMVYHVSREIKHSYQIPLTATIHATEWGRNQGKLQSDLSHKIHHLEWNLCYEAYNVIVCSRAMSDEVKNVFQLPQDKVQIIPNGIHLNPSETQEKSAMTRKSENQMPSNFIIFYIGRLVFEKGIHVLIEAMPHILQKVAHARLVIAGSGPMASSLWEQAQKLNLGERIQFTGFLAEEEKDAYFKQANLCVFPSLYEPFGIVALEAIRYKRPVVVSDVGGLAELIDHGRDGYKALPGHVESLAWHITDLALHPGKSADMAEQAYRKLKSIYSWERIAQMTKEIYDNLSEREDRASAVSSEYTNKQKEERTLIRIH